MTLQGVKNTFLRLWAGGVVAFSLLAASTAFAEEGGDAGLPQMDSTKFPEQLFWLAISFGVLYLAMSRLALPGVAETKKKRDNAIASELAAAHAASELVKATIASTERALAGARSRAMAQVSAQMTEVMAENAKHQSEQERKMMRELHRAEAEIAVAREGALNAIKSSAAELSAAIVDKCLNVKKKVA